MTPEKIQIADLLAPLWVWLLSFLGALVGFLDDIKPEDKWPVMCFKILTKLSSSALAGVLTYHALLAMDVDSKWHVVAIGIAGHMGAEALRLMGDKWKSRAQ